MASTLSPSAPLPEPLRLPHGSIRGFLSIVLVGTFAYILTRDRTAPTVLVNAVVVVLAFFFGTRGPTATPSPPAAGTVATGHSRIVRGLLVVAFAGLAGWFVRSGWSLSAFPPELVQIWEVLGGYVLGLGLSWAFHRHAHENLSRRHVATLFRDLSAAGALLLTLFACVALATGLVGMLSGYVEQALSLVITYYFGSRVIAR